MRKKPIIAGIAGGSGSGKTTLTKAIAQRFEGSVSILTHDDYYKAHDDMTYEERSLLNYDEPSAFDNDLFTEHLARLRDGEGIDCPTYDYSQHNRSDRTKHIEALPIILVDGILIFTEKRILDKLDIKIYVDTDADIRFIRRLNRDINERGRTVESVIEQYKSSVKPMHEKYVEPSKREADVIIPEERDNPVAIEMVTALLSKLLTE